MAGTRKKLDLYRDPTSGEWRWTLTRAGRIVGASTEFYKRRRSVELNVLSCLGVNLGAVEFDRDDPVIQSGTAARVIFVQRNGKRETEIELIHVKIWKKK